MEILNYLLAGGGLVALITAAVALLKMRPENERTRADAAKLITDSATAQLEGMRADLARFRKDQEEQAKEIGKLKTDLRELQGTLRREERRTAGLIDYARVLIASHRAAAPDVEIPAPDDTELIDIIRKD